MANKLGIFLDCNPSWGGQYQYNLCLLEALSYLKTKNFEIVVVYTEKSWEEDLKNYSFQNIYTPSIRLSHFYGIALTLIHFPFSLWRKICRFFDPVANTLYQQKADLWIFSSYTFNSYQMPVHSIGVIHDLMHRYEKRFPELGHWMVYHWRELAFHNCCKFNTGIFVDSNLGKQQLLESYPIVPEKIHILPFIPPKYIYCRSLKTCFEELNNVPRKFIFYPAQFWEHKNHKNLVEAILQLKSEIPDIYLVLVGSRKNNYEAIRQMVKQTQLEAHVLFLGYVSNDTLVELYRGARAMIYPSFIGPTNIPPLEAMAIGCPCAVSDVYAMKEQLDDAVIYFNPNSVEEIARSIRNLWLNDDLCNALIAKGKERIQRCFTQEIFNQNVHSILNKKLKSN